jgi:hypothetical protein
VALIDVKANPTPKDLAVFAVMWLAFFPLLGLLAWTRPGAMLVAAAITGGALLVSLTLNAATPRRLQWIGAAIPAAILAFWGAARLLRSDNAAGAGLWVMLAAGGAIGAAGCLLIASRPHLGAAIYRGWMQAAVPIGWTLSHIILGAAYYGVVTPIGLLLRALGKDPMNRAFDRAAPSYWTPREKVSDPARYFRQF